MREVVFLLEELSAREMLKGLLPRLGFAQEDTRVRYIVFEGKSDLDRQLVRKLQGYQVPDARFVILRDKDSADCHDLKKELLRKCREAGKDDALVRIACHEIESWYLADLAAVEKALSISGLSEKQDRASLRKPDALPNASEQLERLTNHVYQKVGGSRAIGPHLDPENTRSRSFSVFVEGVRRLVS
ncbi:MAG: DUF4276 family protein [Phycisphaerae bacterium]